MVTNEFDRDKGLSKEHLDMLNKVVNGGSEEETGVLTARRCLLFIGITQPLNLYLVNNVFISDSLIYNYTCLFVVLCFLMFIYYKVLQLVDKAV